MEKSRNTHVIDRLVIEAITAGLAFGSLLSWASTCLVGSFRPQGLANPYWPSVPNLRTDTAGLIAFIICAICLITSEYLRLHRRKKGEELSSRKFAPAKKAVWMANVPIRPITQAVCETVAVRLQQTGLVGDPVR